MHKYTAIAYYAGIPPNNKNSEKPMILDYFCQGVKAQGDTAIAQKTMSVMNCDVALIQGFVHEQGKQAPHLQLRQQVINTQKQNGKRCLIVDSNLFLYSNNKNPLHYLRYSFDGVFPNTGFYFDTDVDPQRWSKISADLNISLKPWRSTGNHILICLQRNGGWSMGGIPVQQWLDKTITEIRKYSQRPIVVRKHPGDKKISATLKINHRNVSVSPLEQSLMNDFMNAWATVVYNSSPSVASAIEGIPTFITDPVSRRSQSFEVANTDLSLIENPKMPERQVWIERLSMSHWNFDELKSGVAWKHFRKYI